MVKFEILKVCSINFRVNEIYINIKYDGDLWEISYNRDTENFELSKFELTVLQNILRAL